MTRGEAVAESDHVGSGRFRVGDRTRPAAAGGGEAEDPRVVRVCLGGNDLLRRLPADQQFDHLRTIIHRIQEKGALVVLIGTEGFKILSPVDYGERYEALARETGAVYVPDLMKGVLGDPALMADQIHPNARGYEKIARRIADEAGDYLAR
jgi:lysophospholipase L1-like esterase